jgi:hypothetical protein
MRNCETLGWASLIWFVARIFLMQLAVKYVNLKRPHQRYKNNFPKKYLV